jgi:hypothetical protein
MLELAGNGVCLNFVDGIVASWKINPSAVDPTRKSSNGKILINYE